jgi:hypothetical protein
MIINVQVELNWIGEEHTVDEIVQEQIIKGIIYELKKEVVVDLKEKSMTQAAAKVDEWIMEELHKFADRKITITDKWGDATEHHESLTEMFKQKFDEFFNASVDKDGKALSGCSYGNNRTTRVQHMLNKMANEYYEKLVKDMKHEIERSVDEARKKAIADSILTHVKKTAGL